jgi:hypothetical protein
MTCHREERTVHRRGRRDPVAVEDGDVGPVASGAVSVMAKVAPNVPDCENNSTAD